MSGFVRIMIIRSYILQHCKIDVGMKKNTVRGHVPMYKGEIPRCKNRSINRIYR